MTDELEPLRKWAKAAARGDTDKIPYIDIANLIDENIQLRAKVESLAAPSVANSATAGELPFIERFDIYEDHGRANMSGDDGGEYVRHDHHVELLRAAIASQQAAPEGYELESQAFGKLLSRVVEFGFDGGHDDRLITFIKQWGNGMYIRGYDKRKGEHRALKPAAELTEHQIGNIFDELGGVSGFCKNFGYLQFARAIEEVGGLNVLLVEALGKIAGWELPCTGKTWPTGGEVSYQAERGSDGVRDYIRQVASDALAAAGATQPKENHGAT